MAGCRSRRCGLRPGSRLGSWSRTGGGAFGLRPGGLAHGFRPGGLAPALFPPELFAPRFLALALGLLAFGLLATGLLARGLGVLVMLARRGLGLLPLRLGVGDADVALHMLVARAGERAGPRGLVLQIGDQALGDLDLIAGAALLRQIALDRLGRCATQLSIVLTGEATEPAQLALCRSDQVGCIRSGLLRGGSLLRRRLLRGGLLRGRGLLGNVRSRLCEQRHHLRTDAITRGLPLQTLEVFPRPSLAERRLQKGDLLVVPAAGVVLLRAVGLRRLGAPGLVLALLCGFALGELARGLLGLEALFLFVATLRGVALGELARGFLGLEALCLFVAALRGFALGARLVLSFLGGTIEGVQTVFRRFGER